MFESIKDLYRYTRVFEKFLGKRIYIIFFLGLIASISEAFGILMLLPLLESLDGSLEESELNDLSRYLFNFVAFIGFENSIPAIIILITFSFLLKGLITFASLGYSAFLIGELLRGLKSELFEKYSSMNFQYYSSQDTGHFTNLINEQPIKALEAFRQLTAFGGQLINTIVLLAIAFIMTWRFGLMAFGVGIILLLVFVNLNNYVRSLSRITATENGILTKWLIQMLHAFKYLTATGQTSLLKVNILKSINTLTDNQIKTGIAAAFTQSVREPIAVVFIMMVVLIQIFVFESKIEPILVSIVLFYRALNATLAVQSGFQGTFQHIGSMELVQDEFTRQENNKSSDGGTMLNPFSKEINIEDLSFKYIGKTEDALKEITLKIPCKSSIAIVGESGSGKSTLIDTISLMHNPTSGKILIDGLDSKEINKKSWRKQIGYVSQDAVIFDDTVANNICMWCGDVDKDNYLLEKIRIAAKKANLLDFIESLPEGFQSMVGDRGLLLSGGQKQRLFIARELFRDPKILILDEATSSLDSESEKEIQKSIDSLLGQITVITIAHRLSTIKNVENIFVLESGSIIENGTYDELIKNINSRFYEMAKLQSL